MSTIPEVCKLDYFYGAQLSKFSTLVGEGHLKGTMSQIFFFFKSFIYPEYDIGARQFSLSIQRYIEVCCDKTFFSTSNKIDSTVVFRL